ncbi:hypothetical protein EC973_009562 [Apophysomyces ossiformis]|uniref:DNA-directed DNA polymerase n=1 Tax=Apophysomyces ossiformis TaxID=679940 RepID=A0A8H7BVI5_9FUNG|nr:hypothetical protein EC973_009562 [Apophysomyces ossiformis]
MFNRSISAASSSHLCSSPETNHPIIDRKTATYDDLPELKQSLQPQDRSFRQQYASLYFVRLLKLRPAVMAAAEKRWGHLPEKPRYIPKVLDVQSGELCYIIGTIYMDLTLKPNILKDLSEESSIIAPPIPPKYRGANDKISLEDESGRMELIGSRLSKEFLVTGMVAAIMGMESATGAFEVVDICIPGIAPQPPLTLNDTADPKFVALVSGLNLGQNAKHDGNCQLLTEFLSGELGCSEDQLSSSRISRLIIAGNSLEKVQAVEDRGKAKVYSYDSSQYDVKPLQQLDQLIDELCGTIDVDLMPGPDDPSNNHMPQQPLHPCMFSRSRSYSTFHSVTNPYWCKVDNITFLGTSGQNLDDIYRYIDGQDRLSMAEQNMSWRHIAPSAPDTLWCYPFQDEDPFLLETSPNVYFIGNQPQFETSMVEGPEGQRTRVVLVPSFAETGIVVLINLSTLECTSLQIGLPSAKIPTIGLGTWDTTLENEATYHAVKSAIHAGYRHIDAALAYRNEDAVGKAIREAMAENSLERSELFVTTKLPPIYARPQRVLEALNTSLNSLGLDYVDLYLMHWPVALNPASGEFIPLRPDGTRDLDEELNGRFELTWEAMEGLLATGKVKAIGVSNFSIPNLERLLKTAKVVPAVNQIELHPYNPQFKLLDYCRGKAIHCTAYSPLGSSKTDILRDPTIERIAKEYGKTPAQVLISWAATRGSVIPKSQTPSRIASNLQTIELPQQVINEINDISKTRTERVCRPPWGVPVFDEDF